MKYNDLALLIRTPIFSKNDLLLAGKKIQNYQFTLWAKKGYLVKLKDGIYAFAKDYEKIKGEEKEWGTSINKSTRKKSREKVDFF